MWSARAALALRQKRAIPKRTAGLYRIREAPFSSVRSQIHSRGRPLRGSDSDRLRWLTRAQSLLEGGESGDRGRCLASVPCSTGIAYDGRPSHVNRNGRRPKSRCGNDLGKGILKVRINREASRSIPSNCRSTDGARDSSRNNWRTTPTAPVGPNKGRGPSGGGRASP